MQNSFTQSSVLLTESLTDIPSSLKDGLNEDGSLDTMKYFLYAKNKRRKCNVDEINKKWESLFQSAEEQSVYDTPKRSRKPNKNNNLIMMSDGKTNVMFLRDSTWYITNVQCPAVEDTKLIKKFRLRFRCSYIFFTNLLEMVSLDNMFRRWLCTNAFGKKSTPIELCLFGTLNYLGRG
jgi:hypothetical protein